MGRTTVFGGWLLLSVLAWGPDVPTARADDPKGELTPAEREKLEKEANRLNEELRKRHLAGEYVDATKTAEQMLAVYRRLYPPGKYPDGHPELALSLNNLGVLLRYRGRYEEALPLYIEALAIGRHQLNGLAAFGSEADALAYARSLPPTLDDLLAIATRGSGVDAVAYDQVWPGKAAITRVLERRHTARRAAADAGTQRRWGELLAARAEQSRLLLAPGGDPAARDRRLRELADTQQRLERELAAALPELPRREELDRLGPADLATRLTAGSAFIDLLGYARFEQDPQKPGDAGERRVPSYTAFVVAPGRPVERAELGDAAPIDAAIRDWRQAITGWNAALPDADRRAVEARAERAAAELSRLVWAKLADHLPAGTKTVYLAPDGDLARLPWAALPGKKPGTVLLEDYALAVVPHGPFLLEHLLYPPKYADGPESVLAVGGVHTDLPASLREVERLKELAGPRPVAALTGEAATPDRLRAELPKARFAHLATHGFFAEAALQEEKRQIEKQLENYRFDEKRLTLPVGLGARSPLAYTGLALAGAGRDARADDRGVVTGEVLVELSLENLRLCVLSACETGLGELTGGEGVQGLVRAFHLAGCPDVVASLWNVNDDATAVLMAEFYRRLWQENLPPIEALRQAQLFVYRNPDQVRAIAAERKVPDFSKSQPVNTGVKPPVAHRPAPPVPAGSPAGTAPPKWWAAFQLSGAGR